MSTKTIALLILAAATSGCAMSPEQIKSMNAGTDAKAMCFHARNGILWSTTTVYVSADKGKETPTINERCEVNAGPVK